MISFTCSAIWNPRTKVYRQRKLLRIPLTFLGFYYRPGLAISVIVTFSLPIALSASLLLYCLRWHILLLYYFVSFSLLHPCPVFVFSFSLSLSSHFLSPFTFCRYLSISASPHSLPPPFNLSTLSVAACFSLIFLPLHLDFSTSIVKMWGVQICYSWLTFIANCTLIRAISPYRSEY